MAAGVQNPFKVKLEQQRNPLVRVIFDVTPDVSESRNIQYKNFDPVHMPGSIYLYQNTGSRIFQLSSIRLVSRTPEEGSKNMVILQRLKGWCMPYFGLGGSPSNSPAQSQPDATQSGNQPRPPGGAADANNPGLQQEQQRGAGGDFGLGTFGPGVLGAPPDVLLFSAYSSTQGGSGGEVKAGAIQHINKVPVVITTLQITYPSDMDYITTGESIPIATIMALEITLNETHSPNEYEQFSIEAYHAGQLAGF